MSGQVHTIATNLSGNRTMEGTARHRADALPMSRKPEIRSAAHRKPCSNRGSRPSNTPSEPIRSHSAFGGTRKFPNASRAYARTRATALAINQMAKIRQSSHSGPQRHRQLAGGTPHHPYRGSRQSGTGAQRAPSKQHPRKGMQTGQRPKQEAEPSTRRRNGPIKKKNAIQQ